MCRPPPRSTTGSMPTLLSGLGPTPRCDSGSPSTLLPNLLHDFCPATLASRLEGLNKYYGTEILISESTYLEAREGVVARPLDWVSVKGKNKGVLVYELVG